MTEIYGVIGDPIGHSLSPAMHNAAFRHLGMECIYLSFHVLPFSLQKFMENAKKIGIKGLNVTLPYKKRIMELVEPDELSKKIGAVNTVDLVKEKGYNTDAIGAKRALESSGIRVKGKNVLVIGAGGAASAIVFQLVKDGAEVTIANRTERRARKLAKVAGCTPSRLHDIRKLAKKSEIIINCTSVGMYPRVDESLLPEDAIRREHTVFDVVYNPVETKLLKNAKRAGAKTVDGLSMLLHQGAESFRIWTGRNPPLDVMRFALKKEMEAK